MSAAPGAPLAGRVALVTGCANPRGMGRAIALALAGAGADVVVTDLCRADERLSLGGLLMLGEDAGALAALAGEIEARGRRALALALDLRDAERIEAVVAETVAAFARLDILVNNAGTAVGAGPFLELDDDAWDLSYAINVKGLVRLCRAVLPVMRRQGGGAIVNNASVMGVSALGGYGAYAATKHAVVGITRVIAGEFAGDGIRCNAVCPGNIHTDMGEAEAAFLSGLHGITREAALSRMSEDCALGRLGRPDEVAEAVLWLAGPQASFVTGVALPISGGLRPGL